MALSASLCKAFSTNVSPSGPSTTETQTLQRMLLHSFLHILRNQPWQAKESLQRKLIIWSNLTIQTNPFYYSQLYESWQVLTVAQMSVEFPDSTDRVRLCTAGCGCTSRCCGSLIWPSAPLWAPGLQRVGQHGETVLHQLEQQNSALQHLFSLTETKT